MYNERRFKNSLEDAQKGFRRNCGNIIPQMCLTNGDLQVSICIYRLLTCKALARYVNIKTTELSNIKPSV